MKQQIMIIHGGDVWETYEQYLIFLREKTIDFNRHGLRQLDWKQNLQNDLGDSFEVIYPDMPSMRNAKYEEWKIWFEKFMPYINDGIILVGGSLGAIFLAKYLSENTFPKKIKAVFLLAGPYSDNSLNILYDFSLTKPLKSFQAQVKQIYLYHSKDDEVVPFTELEKYQKELPNSIVRVFEGKGHFNAEHIPELVEDIKHIPRD